MLTCKLGETIINCFDNTYDRYTFKKWSNKNILKCPVCDGIYEYCHGEVAPPYFRHKEKECKGYYTEQETDEHREGKKLLFEWVKNINGVSNCKLEHWIPETKQRPDVYFEFDNKKFVIEFQCTPIASELLLRRELYKLNDIHDIWIMGLNRYNLEIKDDAIIHNQYKKTIEDHSNIYLNVEKRELIKTKDEVIPKLHHKELTLKEYYAFDIENFDIDVDSNEIVFNTAIIEWFINEDQNKYNENKSKNLFIYATIENVEFIYKKLKEDTLLLERGCTVELGYTNRTNYIASLYFHMDGKRYAFFVKDYGIDACIAYATKRYFGRRLLPTTKYMNESVFELDVTNQDDIISAIQGKIYSLINDFEIDKSKTEKRKVAVLEVRKSIFKEFLDEEIILVNATKNKKDYTFKFKFLKGFKVTDEYMKNVFINELRFLKRKKAKKYIFMIPHYHSYFNNLGFSSYVRVGDFDIEILSFFEDYGFSNVKYYDESEENN